MSPGRTTVTEEIHDLVAETGDVLLQLLETERENNCELCCLLTSKMKSTVFICPLILI